MGNFAHGYTYSGHPVGCAVAMTNLDIIERDHLIDYANVQGVFASATSTVVISPPLQKFVAQHYWQAFNLLVTKTIKPYVTLMIKSLPKSLLNAFLKA